MTPEQIEMLADFMDAMDEWGCDDNQSRAQSIADFIASGFDLTEYENGRTALRVIQGGKEEKP